MQIKTLALFAAMTFVATLSTTIQTSAQGPIFAPVVAYGSGGYDPNSVAVGDLNGDGKPDLVIANGCISSSNCNNATVGVLLGNGDGTFQTVVAYNTGGYGSLGVALADVNGDGKLDLLVANACISNSICNKGTTVNGTVSVLLGKGDGSFWPAVAYDSGGVDSRAVAVADVDGDGKLDLVVANSGDCSNGCYVGQDVSVLLGNGDGTFQTAVAYASAGNRPFFVAVSDVNGDSKLDLVVANHCVGTGDCSSATVSVLLGNGDGTFQTAVAYASGGGGAYSVAVGDVNGDGKADIMVANCGSDGSECGGIGIVGVLLGNGDGTFQPAVAYGSGGIQAGSVAIADVDGDGKPDLLVANACADSTCTPGSVGVLFGNGDGTFQTAVAYGSGGRGAFSVAVADVNGDKKPDVLVANSEACGGCTNGSVGVLLNIIAPPYKAFVQQPINADGSSIFNAKRGVIPVKFTLTQNGAQTCALPPATISVTRTAGGTTGAIDEASYLSPADNGSNFRIDASACQYIYNLAANSLGVGTYRVDITISGSVVGSAVFVLK